MIIFSRSPGRTFRFEETAIPMTVAVEGISPGLNCCLAAIGIAGRANARVSHAFKKMVYVYTMGERVGDLQVSGVTFPGQCEGTNQVGPFPASGLENILDYYYNRFGLVAHGQPVRVTTGFQVLEGLLMGFRVDTNDPTTGVGAFSLVMNFFPDLRASRRG